MEETYKQFARAVADSLGVLDLKTVRMVNEALAAFLFTTQMGGHKVGDGRLRFPEGSLPAVFQSWHDCGAIMLTREWGEVFVSIPFFCLRRFFVERAQCPEWADQQQLYHLFCAHASQPSTFIGIVWQMALATELMDRNSPLWGHIIAAFAPHFDLSSVLIHPPLKSFRVPSDIDGKVEYSKSAFAVYDKQGGTERRSTDVTCPVLDKQAQKEKPLKIEAKCGSDTASPSGQNLDLRRAGAEFFKTAEENNRTARSRTLNLYVSLIVLKLAPKYRWASELNAHLSKPGNSLLHGPQIADGCRTPLHLFIKPRWDISDFAKWQAGIREDLLQYLVSCGDGW